MYASAPISSSVSASSALPPCSMSILHESPTRGLAHVPEKASEPPHCCAMMSDESAQGDRSALQAIRTRLRTDKLAV
eukprot:scaffold153469_cov32-Tisochrysis_lutea.AAC.4